MTDSFFFFSYICFFLPRGCFYHLVFWASMSLIELIKVSFIIRLERYAGYVHIGTCRISLDHKFLAYTLDISGNESFTLQVKDLHSGHVMPNSKVEGVVSLAWAGDSSCLLYTVCDATQRPYRQCSIVF